MPCSFFANNLKLKYLSFAFLALACLVRYEGIVLILPLSFLFIFENRRNKIIIPKFLLCISIFLLVLLPMLLVRMDTIGYDGIFSHSVSAVEVYSSGSKIVHGDIAVFSFVKATALAVFPIFFIFLPLGIYGFFRRRSFDKYVILSFLIFLSLPVIYASIREMSEPRYFLTLFPIFSLFSLYTVKEIIGKLEQKKTILIITGFVVLSLSVVFLEYNKIDWEYERESYQIGLEVHKRTSVINEYLPEVKYAYGKDDIFWNVGTFPVLHSETERKVKTIKTYDSDRCTKEKQLESGCRQYDYASLSEFIKIGPTDSRNDKYGENIILTHIIADENANRPEFIKDVFENEAIPYLTKIYDSSEHGYQYHLKIFQIDYEKFEPME